MLNVRLKTGEEYPAEWIGISELDGSLRMSITDGDLAELFQTFNRKEKTETITRIFDEDEKSYEGYTGFKGIERFANGNVVVRMEKGT